MYPRADADDRRESRCTRRAPALYLDWFTEIGCVYGLLFTGALRLCPLPLVELMQGIFAVASWRA